MGPDVHAVLEDGEAEASACRKRPRVETANPIRMRCRVTVTGPTCSLPCY